MGWASSTSIHPPTFPVLHAHDAPAAPADTSGYAIYFSRGVLPSNKDGEVRCDGALGRRPVQRARACCHGLAAPPEPMHGSHAQHLLLLIPKHSNRLPMSPCPSCRRSYPAPWHDKPYLLHLGLQCYDRAFLRQYCKMAATPLQVWRGGREQLGAVCCSGFGGQVGAPVAAAGAEVVLMLALRWR